MATRLATYVVVGIVAVTLIAGLIVGAQRDDIDGPVDLIVFNAKVYTADASGSVEEAVAIRGNQILRVGSNRDINRLRRPQTEVIDARGATILPGFNDAYVQFLRGGIGLDQIDLLDATSLDEVSMRIRTWAGANPDRPWILGRGWTNGVFAGSGPTRQMLDAIVPDRPAQIVSADGRSSWVNSKALVLARITKRTRNPAAGIIVKDARSGEPAGVLTDEAMALVGTLVPQPDGEQKRRALHAAIAEAHRHGITSIHDAIEGAEDAVLYEDSERAGDLKLRVYLSVPSRGGADEGDLRSFDALSSKYPDDPLLKAGAVRIRIGAGAAAIDAENLNRAVRILDSRGWQVIAEASDDRTVRLALDAYAHAVRSNPQADRGRRHRIERADFADATDGPRFEALGVIASTAPLLGGPSTAGAARLAFGSGWPAAPLNPMAAIHSAVNRAPALPLKRAIDAWTSGAAYASFDEQRKGSLEAGMLADLVVLSTDIFALPASRLGATDVALTIFDGEIVYRRDKSID